MTNDEIDGLVNKYFNSEEYKFPITFEHRLETRSSSILYSLIRHFKPKKCLEIGTWRGGSTCLILSALLKNKNPFFFIASELLPDMRLATAANCLQSIGLCPMIIGDITKSENILPKNLDFLFVDTDHDRETTEWIVKNIWPRLRKGALFAMHDWAVWQEGESILGKGENGKGGTPETEYLFELYRKGEFPFEKLHWTYKNPDLFESGFWLKK